MVKKKKEKKKKKKKIRVLIEDLLMLIRKLTHRVPSHAYKETQDVRRGLIGSTKKPVLVLNNKPLKLTPELRSQTNKLKVANSASTTLQIATRPRAATDAALMSGKSSHCHALVFCID